MYFQYRAFGGVLQYECLKNIFFDSLHKQAKLLADAQALEAKLQETVIELKVKANEDGKIFGAVTTAAIAAALEAQEILIDKKVITIPEPIKECGEHMAQARLHREVKADIKLNVVAE